MAVLRKIRLSSKFTGNGVDVGDGGDGAIDIAAGAITSTELADGNVTTVKLQNGASSPGNSKYYGTNSSGTVGFFDLPSGGGSGDSSTTVRLTTTNGILTIKYTGSTVPTFVENSSGVFTITAPTGTKLIDAVFEGTSASVSSAMATFNFVDTDGNWIHFIPFMLRMDTFQPIGLVVQAILPTQDDTTTGTVQSVWSNMNFSPFQINFDFQYKYPEP